MTVTLQHDPRLDLILERVVDVAPETPAGNFFDYTPATLLTTYRTYARKRPASLVEGVF